jgi:hypothetical protein
MSPVSALTGPKPSCGIDTTVERTVPLAKAARQLESSRIEGHAHPGTLHRWRLRGVRGILLQCIKVGGVWHTSREALQRFFERVTAAEQAANVQPLPSPARPSKSQQAGKTGHDTEVEAELDSVLGGTRLRQRPQQGDR